MVLRTRTLELPFPEQVSHRQAVLIDWKHIRPIDICRRCRLSAFFMSPLKRTSHPLYLNHVSPSPVFLPA